MAEYIVAAAEQFARSSNLLLRIIKASRLVLIRFDIFSKCILTIRKLALTLGIITIKIYGLNFNF